MFQQIWKTTDFLLSNSFLFAWNASDKLLICFQCELVRYVSTLMSQIKLFINVLDVSEDKLMWRQGVFEAAGVAPALRNDGGGSESLVSQILGAPSTFSQEWLTVFVIRSLQRYEHWRQWDEVNHPQVFMS